jgi:hypothetical protein
MTISDMRARHQPQGRIDVTNHCGSCTACCKVFAISEMPEKMAGDWCQHCAIGKGCKIYEERPPTCIEFECLWLMSQRRNDPRERLAPELRPDRSKVVFAPSTNERVMSAVTMPGSPLAWQRSDVMAVIRKMTNAGMGVVCGAPASTLRTMVDRHGMHEVHLTEPDHLGMQWSIPDEDQ